MAKNLVGTSGFQYKHWKKNFYPKDLRQKEWFSYYQSKFSTVELNVTFYRTPSFETFKKWHDESKKDFIFAIKGNQYITRYKKIKDAKRSIDMFFDAASGLREKLGVVLWQLPPNFFADQARLLDFCQSLEKNSYSKKVRHAFEFRNDSWFSEEIFTILRKFNFANCIADSPVWPKNKTITADFTYLRFHGSKKPYGSEYSKQELKRWAEEIKGYKKQGLDVYAYFNNDAFGFAPKNALELISNLD